jgi:surface antigen
MRLGLAGMLACLTAGCSMPLHMDSLFERAGKPETTASIQTAAEARASAQLPPEADLVFTRRAVSEVLTRGQQDASVQWENPATGARGSVTAIAAAYTIDSAECRDFLASYVHGEKESWLRGEACRRGKGPWEVRAFKPWIRS